MHKLPHLLLLFLVSFAVASAPRTALVIGNSNYAPFPTLTNPVNDAHDIAEKLELLDFEVILKTDLGRKAMRDAIRQFGNKLKQKGGAGIFFYAGHGAQAAGKNYLIPVDADIQAGYELPDESVAAELLLRALEDAGNPLNIVVLDACRNNPFPASSRSGGKGLARMEGGRGTLIAFSTGPGDVAMDGEGRNSPYTKHLLQHMTETGLSIEQVFKRVRVDVENETNGRQTTWESSSLRGDFYFVPELQKQVAQTSPATPVFNQTIATNNTTRTTESTTSRIETAITEDNALGKSSLTIYTNPQEAKIRILNLDREYHPGIRLKPGDYNIEVSKDGYYSKKQWIAIDQKNQQVQVTLVPD